MESAFLAMVVVASLAAALVLALDSIGDEARQRSSRQFQSLLGGLGMGSHADLSRCPWLFDARLAGDQPPALEDASNEPDGCPWHAMSIFPAPESYPSYPDLGERAPDAVDQ
ncbi:MAG TPA: hypothetical protein VMV69_06570 [Pirellulales bacterium]|nr:hypothetical protein [Pirellulales bacterium]